MSCDAVYTFAIPGPVGPAGTNGTNGTNGASAFTQTTASFVMPAEGANVTIAVTNSGWTQPNQIVFISAGGIVGYFKVVAIPAGTALTIQNLENTAASQYTVNSAPGSTFASAARVSASGPQGPSGAAAAGAFEIANNLSEGTPAAMRASLVLGSLAVLNAINNGNWSGAALAIANGGTGQATAPLGLAALGGQPLDSTLTSLAALGSAADKIAYTTALDTWAEASLTTFMRSVLSAVDASAARTALGVTTANDMLLYYDVRGTGVNSDSFAAGSWIAVPLNSEEVDQGNHGSIAGNQVTLLAGTYRYRFGVVAFNAGQFQGRMFNVTSGNALAGGEGNSAICGAGVNDTSEGAGRFTIAGTTIFRLEGFHLSGTVTFGNAANTGVREHYSFLELYRE